MKTCLGIDVGGTFTDAVLTDGTTTWRLRSSRPGQGQFMPADAAHAYGVVVGDPAATARQRVALGQARLDTSQEKGAA